MSPYLAKMCSILGSIAVLGMASYRCGNEPVARGKKGQPCHEFGTCDRDFFCTEDKICEVLGKNGDCRDAQRACFAPRICELSATTGSYVCVPEKGTTPACKGTPPGQVVPFATADHPATVGPTVHWMLKPGCIAVSYAPSLEDRVDEIAAAAGAWNDVDCTALCLGAPFLSATPPAVKRGERRIHFRMAGGNDYVVYPAETTTFFDEKTGQILSVEVLFETPREVESSDFLQLFGYALGLGAAAENAESIMAPPEDPRTRTTLSAADRLAICALYGNPSYCGD